MWSIIHITTNYSVSVSYIAILAMISSLLSIFLSIINIYQSKKLSPSKELYNFVFRIPVESDEIVNKFYYLRLRTNKLSKVLK